MKKTVFSILSIILIWPALALAENYTVKGEMGANIRYELQEQVTSGEGIKKMVLSFVKPQTFQSPTYRQEIRNFKLLFSPEPQERKTQTDGRGNEIIVATWTDPPQVINVRLSCDALSETRFPTLATQDPFPLVKIDQEMVDYLKPTEQVQSDNPRIRELATQLTSGVKTEFDAVQRVVSWVVDHVRYVTPPVRYDAIYSLESGKGNCQNYSHLSAALLRAVGIPVRIVNGVTLNQPFDIAMDKWGVLTLKMGHGRHSWIEIWFPQLGWVPLDPQNTMLFVSNRFVRVEVGIDNNETKNDGLFRWAQLQEAQKPKLQESISANFESDQINVRGNRQNYGPKNLLLSPLVKAEFKQIEVVTPPPPPVISEKLKKALRYNVPFTYGNLEYPENLDFAFPRITSAAGKNQFEMSKSFLVETAEYVTTNLTQYAQVFVLQKPVTLKKIGLALHNFGGDGWLWVDILQDNKGKPGMPIGTSGFINLDQLSLKPGYRWADFDFSKESPILMPGAYWIALGFTGSPIVNWFYTYGKPVGPVDGTRYKGVFQDDW
ncbi:MAG: transglutaminase-like domain-containing protein, partial [Deltaproteobacteria bacterium]|nr:transglutaminase-like domain-containing protein [Deltaproteobacteria bacterium]